MIKLPKLNVVRIPLGFLLVLIGTIIASIPYVLTYILGAMIALIGAWVFSKNLNRHFRGGIGWLLFGMPLFFFSLLPQSFNWLSEFGATNMAIFVSRFIAVFLGAITFLMVYETD